MPDVPDDRRPGLEPVGAQAIEGQSEWVSHRRASAGTRLADLRGPGGTLTPGTPLLDEVHEEHRKLHELISASAATGTPI